MRKHINTYVFSPLFLLMASLLLVLFVLVVALFTPIGPKMTAYIADTVFEELTLNGVSGTLITGLHIDEFEWKSDATVSLKNININVKKYDIQAKKLVASRATVSKLTINIPEGKKSTNQPHEKFVLPDFGLPINVDADFLELKSLQITETIAADPGSRNLLFEIKNIDLKKVVIKDGYLDFDSLQGAPIIVGEELQIDVVDGKLNMNLPHDINTQGKLSYDHPNIGRFSGQLFLSGTLTDYEVKSNLEWQQKNLGKQAIQLEGVGNYRQVALSKIHSISEHGKIDATGLVNWDPEIRWFFDVNAQDLDSMKLFPEWPIKANSRLKYTGSYLDSRLENQLEVINLAGIFRDQKLTASGQITEREGLLRANNFNITLGNNRIKANGAISEPLSIDLAIDSKNVKQFIPQLAGNVTGKVEIKGSYKRPEINAKLSATKLAFNQFVQTNKPINVEGNLAVINSDFVLEGLSINSGSNRLKIEGKVSEPVNLKWEVNTQKLDQIFSQIGGGIKGSGDLKGSYTKLESNLDIALDQVRFNGYSQGNLPLKIKGNVSLDEKLITVKSLMASSGVNSTQLSGQISEPLDLRVIVDANNLAEVSPDISGTIQADTTIKGLYKSPVIITNAKATKLKLKGTLLTNSEVTLEGEMQILDGVPNIKSLNARAGDNRIIISGRASAPYDLKWEVDSKNLQQISPEISGRIVAKGNLKGTIEKPIVNATVDAKKIKYKTFELDSADLIASTKDGIYNIKGKLQKLKNKEQTIKSAEIDLNGRIENHTLNVLVDHQQGKLSLKANGAWRDQQWSGQVSSLKLSDTETGDWQLQQATKLALSRKSIKADKFCIGNKKTQACSTLDYADGVGFAAKGTLKETPLRLFKLLLPENIVLNGNVSANYEIKQNNGKPSGTIKIILPDNSFTIRGEDKSGDDDQSFAYKDAEIEATINNRTINASASGTIVDRGKFTAKATINLSPENGKHTIDGSAQFDIPNIYFAQNLIPRTRGLRGEFTSKLSFSGLLNKPQIKGQADIKNAYLRLPEAGSELTNININLRADSPGKAVINGKMQMGNGLLTISGDIDLRDITKWKSTLNISGDNLRFMNTNEIRASMSPNLIVGISPELVTIQGKVIIPEADIKLKDIPETSIDESEDAFVIGEKKKGENVSAVKIRPDVTIQLGDKIRIDAFGLKAKLSGDVQITNNRREILANGSLRVTDGSYQAYGQNLDINNGRLIFNGSPKLVGMDIRATRKVDDTTVGIHLGGTLRKPSSTIFSDPTLPESEALSYLITGHSLSSSSGREGALLLSAVRTLGVAGSGSLIENIGSSFGLDDVNLVTKDDLRQSGISLGKRLGPKLYVRYLIGLFDQTQQLALEYKINKFLSLEAQISAEDIGLDFIYQIERD
jgi:translocation and assembly module TamB